MNIPRRSFGRLMAIAMLLTLGFTAPASAQVPGDIALKCDAERIEIAGTSAMGAFSCYAKFTKNPLKDPGALTLAVCLNKWGEKAGLEFDEAGDTAVKLGGFCSYNGSAGAFVGSIGLFAKALTDEITDGVDVSNRSDNKLRSILVKESGRYTDAILAAQAKYILYGSTGKLEKAKAKAKARFLKKTGKALGKAGKKGIMYRGPSPEELAESIESFAADMVATLNVSEV